eukprot:scaffold7451_cov123-Skeletonema_dohrnii-CCMP3373.AAC.3
MSKSSCSHMEENETETTQHGCIQVNHITDLFKAYILFTPYSYEALQLEKQCRLKKRNALT